MIETVVCRSEFSAGHLFRSPLAKLRLLVRRPWAFCVRVGGVEGAWVQDGKRDPAVPGQEGAQWDDSCHPVHGGLGECRTARPYLGVPYRVPIAFVRSLFRQGKKPWESQGSPYGIECLDQVVKETREEHALSPAGLTCRISVSFCPL